MRDSTRTAGTAALLSCCVILIVASASDAAPSIFTPPLGNNNKAELASTVSLSPPSASSSLMQTQRYYAGMTESEIEQNDAYRQQNPFFEQCIERADRLSGQFGVGLRCGNVATMTTCTPSCRTSFESYFRTLTTACWVEIIVGLTKLHPQVAAHWKAFGENVDTLCYHPPPMTTTPAVDVVVASTPPPVSAEEPMQIPPADDDNESPDADETAQEEEEAGVEPNEEPPKGDVVIKDDFSFPQRFSDGMDSEFPDRVVDAPYVKPSNIADKLPWRRQHLMGRFGKSLDKATKADQEPEVSNTPDTKKLHIGPQDRFISFDAEREKGWLPGLDND